MPRYLSLRRTSNTLKKNPATYFTILEDFKLYVFDQTKKHI